MKYFLSANIYLHSAKTEKIVSKITVSESASPDQRGTLVHWAVVCCVTSRVIIVTVQTKNVSHNLGHTGSLAHHINSIFPAHLTPGQLGQPLTDAAHWPSKFSWLAEFNLHNNGVNRLWPAAVAWRQFLSAVTGGVAWAIAALGTNERWVLSVLANQRALVTWGACPLTPSSSGPGSSRLSQLLLSLRPPAAQSLVFTISCSTAQYCIIHTYRGCGAQGGGPGVVTRGWGYRGWALTSGQWRGPAVGEASALPLTADTLGLARAGERITAVKRSRGCWSVIRLPGGQAVEAEILLGIGWYQNVSHIFSDHSFKIIAGLDLLRCAVQSKEVICEQFIEFLNDALALVQLWEGFSWSRWGPVWAAAQ